MSEIIPETKTLKMAHYLDQSGRVVTSSPLKAVGIVGLAFPGV